MDHLLKMSIPSTDECIELLKYYKVDQSTVEHCIVVAELSRQFAEKLIASGHLLDKQLIEAAALLHDIARGEKEHAACGAQWIAKLGYPRISEIVNNHMDLPQESIDIVDESAIVYMADKLVSGNQRVSIEERFNKAMSLFGENEQIISSIKIRLDNAKKIQQIIEEKIGG